MAEFTEKDWRSPEEFEKVVREFATSKFVLVGDENGTDWNMVSRSSVSASKSDKKHKRWIFLYCENQCEIQYTV